MTGGLSGLELYKMQKKKKRAIDKTCTAFMEHGEGRGVCRCREMERREEVSDSLIKHPNNHGYYRGRDKEMKLKGFKRILGEAEKVVMRTTVLRERC